MEPSKVFIKWDSSQRENVSSSEKHRKINLILTADLVSMPRQIALFIFFAILKEDKPIVNLGKLLRRKT
jgi:hypothetical protein